MEIMHKNLGHFFNSVCIMRFMFMKEQRVKSIAHILRDALKRASTIFEDHLNFSS